MATNIPKVVLTGGIASGKSTVAAEFAKLGVPVIDTDEISRVVVQPGRPGLRHIVEQFGREILNADGTLNRKKLRELVFNDPAKRQALEKILHPAIRVEQLRLAESVGGPYQIHVVPLLAETANRHLYDRVLLVDCPREEQLQRLLARDGVTKDLAESMLAAQATREHRLSLADDVIDNSGDPSLLPAQVTRLHERYLKELAKRP